MVIVLHNHQVFEDALVALDVRLCFDTVGVFCDYTFGMCAGLWAPSVTLDGDCCVLHLFLRLCFGQVPEKVG